MGSKKTEPEPKVRQKRTPEERALEALGTAERQYVKATEKLAAHNAETASLEAEAKATRDRLAYVVLNPDLPVKERDRVANALAGTPEEPVAADA